MTNLPCERLFVIACGSVNPTAFGAYLTRLRREVASEIRVVATADTGALYCEEPLQPTISGLVACPLDDAGRLTVQDLQLARWAQTTLVLPATVGILDKVANGVADDSASMLLLDAPRPVLFAPAMNEKMWLAAAVRRNVRRLREAGHHVIEPVDRASLLTEGHQRSDNLIGPTLEMVLAHTMHVVLRQLRETMQAGRTPH